MTDLVAMQQAHPELRRPARDNRVWARHVSSPPAERLPQGWVAADFAAQAAVLPGNDRRRLRKAITLARHPGNYAYVVSSLAARSNAWGWPDLRPTLALLRQDAYAFYWRAAQDAATAGQMDPLAFLLCNARRAGLFTSADHASTHACIERGIVDLLTAARESQVPADFMAHERSARRLAFAIDDVDRVDTEFNQLKEARVRPALLAIENAVAGPSIKAVRAAHGVAEDLDADFHCRIRVPQLQDLEKAWHRAQPSRLAWANVWGVKKTCNSARI